MKDSFLNFEYNCEKISLEAITVQKKKGGQGLIETQYRSYYHYLKFKISFFEEIYPEYSFFPIVALVRYRN